MNNDLYKINSIKKSGYLGHPLFSENLFGKLCSIFLSYNIQLKLDVFVDKPVGSSF